MTLLEAITNGYGKWGRVGDFFEITRRPRNLPQPPTGTFSFVPMEAIPRNRYSDPAYEVRPWGRVTGTYFERGDLLVAKISPSFENGKQATAAELDAPFGFATTEVIPLRPVSPGDTDRRLLFFYLLHPEVRQLAGDRMEGTTGRQRLSEQVLLDLPYPVLDFDRQQAIAELLVDIFKTIDTEEQAIRVASALRRVLHREILGDAQRTELTDGWVEEELGDRCLVSSGGTPSRRVDAFWTDGAIPWVKTTEVNYGVITETEEVITEEGLKASAAKRLPPDTLLLAMYGQGVTRGRVAMLGVEAASNQASAAIRPNPEVLLPRFLFHYLAGRYDFIRSRAHGGQQQNLNLDLVRALPIAYPVDLNHQRQIVAALDMVGEIADLRAQKKSTLWSLFVSLIHGLLVGDIEPEELGSEQTLEPQIRTKVLR